MKAGAIRILLCFAAMMVLQAADGQVKSVTLAFYNTENFFDTIPSLFYDDSEYTPAGNRQWNTLRYSTKVGNLARVIDDLDADVIGLAELENEGVVRDLVEKLSDDYNYIHRTSGDRRGMDLALLFRGDVFVPDAVELLYSGAGREFLYVRGELVGERIDLIIVHLPSMFNSVKYREGVFRNLQSHIANIMRTDSAACPIVMGDFNATPRDRLMKRYMGTGRKPSGPLIPMIDTKKFPGSYVYGGKWELLDNIFVPPSISERGFRVVGAGVFSAEYMLGGKDTDRAGHPLRTFETGRWAGGYSDHLPVFLIMQPNPRLRSEISSR